MFCLYTLALARPAQVKIQMLTTSMRIVTIYLKSLLKSLGLILPLHKHTVSRKHKMVHKCFGHFHNRLGFGNLWIMFPLNPLRFTLAVILFGLGGLFMSKMPMFQRAAMRDGGLPLPPAFQYLILMM